MDDLFRVRPHRQPVFTIKADGTVELGEGVTLDEAGRAFWDAIAAMAPPGFRLVTVPASPWPARQLPDAG